MPVPSDSPPEDEGGMIDLEAFEVLDAQRKKTERLTALPPLEQRVKEGLPGLSEEKLRGLKEDARRKIEQIREERALAQQFAYDFWEEKTFRNC